MKNIVTVGGGTGSYIVLSGLNNLPDINLSALVSMADDGGSTGVLRRNWKVMPAGDVRQCLVALSGKEFLNSRFNSGPFKGHKVGNVLLATIEKITGDFSIGVKVISFLLGVKGKVIPITKDDAVLEISFLNNHPVVMGESAIDEMTFPDEVKNLYYKNSTTINQMASEAIASADYIIIGPGDYFTSTIPCLIIEGFRDALLQSKAKIIFLINLVNKPGHTAGWDTKKHIDTIEKYLGKKVDLIFINNKEFSSEQRERYLEDGGEKIFKKDSNPSRSGENSLCAD